MEAGSSNVRPEYGKKGFALVFNVLRKALVGEGWLFEQRRWVL